MLAILVGVLYHLIYLSLMTNGVETHFTGLFPIIYSLVKNLFKSFAYILNIKLSLIIIEL
jgi:hypothetical protein